MSNQHPNQNRTEAIADADALAAMAQRTARSWAMYLVLMGVAAAVGSLLMGVLKPTLGIGLGLVVIVLAVVAAARFTSSHQHGVARFARINRLFWPAHLAGVLASVVGAATHLQWPICAGGTLSVLAGAVAGHFVFHDKGIAQPGSAQH